MSTVYTSTPSLQDPYPSWRPISDATRTVSIEDLQAERDFIARVERERKRQEETILLLQTVFPDVWEKIDAMLIARDALLNGTD